MVRVLHLIDDAGMGGVTRVLRDHLPRLSDGFSHEIRRSGTEWRLPGVIEADIIIVHFTTNWAKLPYLASIRMRAPKAALVLVEHSYTAAYERLCVRNQCRFRTLLRLTYGMVGRVVAVSLAQAEWLRQAKLVPEHRLSTIVQSCDTAGLLAIGPVTPGPGPLRLGAIGRYAPQKGFDILLRAMRDVPAETATLEIAGAGPDLEHLQALASDLPHVSVGGPVEAAASFLPRLDAVVIPSRWEAFVLVAAEARAAGRPVVAAQTDGLTEQVSPASGVLFPALDTDRLARAIRSLAWCDLRQMGEAGRRSVAAAFDTTIAQWRRLLDELSPPTGAVETW